MSQISTHAPLAGRDMGGFEESGARVIFQPTRPLRGATDVFAEMLEEEKFQPTRPLRGATGTYTPKSTQIFISTHAPLAGRDRLSFADHPC